ncbi:MAG: four helix bundle protein [Planctomycetota bacterium]|jgi:four helix bundle protein
MQDHRKLKAFQLTDAFVLAVYEATKSFQQDERFGLTSQLRRAAVSAAANIVEGCGRYTRKDYLHFLGMAMGSLREAGYLVSLAERLGYLPEAEAAALLAQYDECARVLSGLITGLRRKT